MTADRIGVIGGGVLGIAVARHLLRTRPGVSVTVLEKEARLAMHQTGRNSGVAHAGVYYVPGSLKATLCRRGVTLLAEYCRRHGVAYHECGKLIVAVDADELPRLDALFQRGQQNGVPELALLGPDELRSIEPHVTGLAALYSPSTAIVDFGMFVRVMRDEIVDLGGTVCTGQEVTKVNVDALGVGVATADGTRWRFDRLVACAGLHADRVAELAGDPPDPRIVPFRGEYFRLRPDRRDLVRGLIYPVPDPRFPFLGIHLTKRVDGDVLIGPNAIMALAREGYRWRDVDLADLLTTLRWRGFRIMARRHWRMGVLEMHRSLSRRQFVAAARRYVPELRVEDVVRAPSGVRAQAVGVDGELLDDFRISGGERVVNVRNAPSPAATSSLAIAELISEKL